MLIELLGGIAILLWGVRMVRTGVVRAFGGRLKGYLEQRLNTPLRAFSAGVVTTLLLGSSTAMALIVAGLASTGSINAATGLIVLLGADVGSAIIATVFAAGSSVASILAPISVLAGYMLFSLSTEFRTKNAGRILLGLGFMLVALGLIVGATEPLRDATLFHRSLEAIANDPLLAFVVGAILAWMFHSTLAVVLLITSFLANGSLDPAFALPFVLGLNFGGGLPAAMATLGDTASARLLPLANLFCRGSLAIVLMTTIAPLQWLFANLPIEPTLVAITAHLAFNTTAACLFLPLSGLVVRGLQAVLPNTSSDENRYGAPKYLDKAVLDTPEAALANATVETLRMSEMLETMLSIALDALKTNKLEPLKEIGQIDVNIGSRLRSVQKYVARIHDGEISARDQQQAFSIVLCASNIEHAGDVIKLNLTKRMKDKVKGGISFTSEQLEQIMQLREVITGSLRLLPAALSTNEVKPSARLAAQKDRFRDLEQAVIAQDFSEALGERKDLRAKAVFVDLIRDMHRINSHIASAGYPVVSAAGKLNMTRLVD
jgi:phosphate:Na+ symporter